MPNQSFDSFDPLDAKGNATTDVQAKAIKREIKNILNSYVGWYDPLSEMIQNALDSVEERARLSNEQNYVPRIYITLDIQKDEIIVTDNGIGLDKKEFQSFLAPDFSFKSGGHTRGRKGVGATYLAYGFNYLQVCTKTTEFSAIGKMTNAKKWVLDDNPAGNPEVTADSTGPLDSNFNEIDRGVSIGVRLDRTTYPADLGWIQVNNATAWGKILSIKTPLGAVVPRSDIITKITVIDKNGNETTEESNGISYLWPHIIVPRSASMQTIQSKRDELYSKHKDPDDLPALLKNLDAVWYTWSPEDLSKLNLDDSELEILQKHKPTIYGAYVYSTKVWDAFNEELGLREKQKVLYAGIQMAAQNMPQGELIEIPLRRYTGRQQNAHFVVHFPECEPDYGRKGFQTDIMNFAKTACSRLVDVIHRYRLTLKPTTGAPIDLQREQNIAVWKNEMEKYEKENPLFISSQVFFVPTHEISITSKPNREQDVIALFNQLLAGGVIRGVRVMSTNERETYDCLHRVIISQPTEHHLYDAKNNPLGIHKDIINNCTTLPFVTSPRVLEYKLSLDALIEDIECDEKNSNDINLVVVWQTGEDWRKNYKITSLLDENNLSLRVYHGVTHVMTNLTTGQREMDLMVLEELIDFLNNPTETLVKQIRKYEEE